MLLKRTHVFPSDASLSQRFITNNRPLSLRLGVQRLASNSDGTPEVPSLITSMRSNLNTCITPFRPTKQPPTRHLSKSLFPSGSEGSKNERCWRRRAPASPGVGRDVIQVCVRGHPIISLKQDCTFWLLH
jgi:hypothetical protein